MIELELLRSFAETIRDGKYRGHAARRVAALVLEIIAVKPADLPTKTLVKNSGLSTFTQNVLLQAGYEYMEDAQEAGSTHLLKQPNLGRKSAKEVMAWRPPATVPQRPGAPMESDAT